MEKWLMIIAITNCMTFVYLVADMIMKLIFTRRGENNQDLLLKQLALLCQKVNNVECSVREHNERLKKLESKKEVENA